MPARLIIAALVSAFYMSAANALVFDDMSKLAGETVIAAGELQQLRCSPGGRYDCSTWPREFYKLGKVCVEVVGGYGVGYVDRGILTVDDRGQVSLFTLSTIASQFKKARAAVYECPR